MARTYSTPLGHAHATYDGSTWHVAAHPSNDPSATDEACPLGGHSYAHGLSFEAWRDEAGFRGRDWRVGRLAQDALGSDQWASLREVAETAIQTASERVAFQRRWGSLRQDRPEPTHLLVYPQGDCDRVSIVSVDGDLTDDTTAVVRLPSGEERTVLTLDLVDLGPEVPDLDDDDAVAAWLADDDDDAAHFGSPAEPVAQADAILATAAKEIAMDADTPPAGTNCAGCTTPLGIDSHDAVPASGGRWLCPDCDDVEADAAIDAQAIMAHAGIDQPDIHPDYVDHARVIAALRARRRVEDAWDAQTGGHVYVVEALVDTFMDAEGTAIEVVAQTSIQPDAEGVDRWLMGVEFRSQADVIHGFNAVPKPGMAPERDDLASAIASDLVAIADALGKGDRPGDCPPGLPGWVDRMERYTPAPDPEWPADYAALGILRDTFACAMHGSRKEAERMAFDLLSVGEEVRVARDAVDPKRWHLAVRGGLAGCPAMWVANIRGGVSDDEVQVCGGDAAGQHPLSIAQ